MTGQTNTGGYFASPWPCEDGGPQRLAQVAGTSLALRTGEQLGCTTRNTLMCTMTVLGTPGEVYLLTHSVLRAKLGLPTTSCVERLDPVTLKTLERSPRLAGGPMWPGGLAIHRNGDLLVVYGRYAHRLDRHCQPRAQYALPVNQPYNSFVLLDNGLLVTKNLSDTTPASLTVLDPHSLQPVCAHLICPEPSIARLSAVGNTVYVVGTHSIFRYTWSDSLQRLEPDPQWQWDYLQSANHTGTNGHNAEQSYGWDVVLDGQSAWWMDNGKHRYTYTMTGRGVSPSPNRLLRASLSNAQDRSAWPVCGLPGGSITNPPVVDRQRNIVVAFDSANRHLQAWRIPGTAQGQTADAALGADAASPGTILGTGPDLASGLAEPLWHKTDFGVASHMLLYPQTGELVCNDYRRMGEEVVVLDIATGEERGRVRTGGLMQGVVFPSPGWSRDLYWCSMGRLARVFVQN